jgi:hypothetical protein
MSTRLPAALGEWLKRLEVASTLAAGSDHHGFNVGATFPARRSPWRRRQCRNLYSALGQALADRKAYLNIHTTTIPGGEIRGFLVVPDPATIGLIAIGGMAVVVAMRNSRRG